jgi:hypothetical protein
MFLPTKHAILSRNVEDCVYENDYVYIYVDGTGDPKRHEPTRIDDSYTSIVCVSLWLISLTSTTVLVLSSRRRHQLGASGFLYSTYFHSYIFYVLAQPLATTLVQVARRSLEL